jgi:hypothetical protein
MQKNLKIAGIVDEPRGQYAARVKVVSYKKGSDWIDDPQTLIELFAPSGYVFGGNILEKFKIGDLLELSVSELPTNPLNDQYKVESSSTCKPIGHRLIKMDGDVKYNEFSIDLSKVMERIETYGILKDFYIQVDREIIGPFNLNAGELTALREIGVNSLSNISIANSNQHSYLFKRPVSEQKIDAMSINQLTVWFKDRLKYHDIVPDPDAVKKALDIQGMAHLDSVRMRRAFDLLDQLELSQNDLSILCQYSQNFAEMFQKSLDRANDEIVKPVIELKNRLLLDISELDNDKEKLNTQISKENEALNSLKSDISYLEVERERLINDIRIHSLIGRGSKTVSKLVKYEVIDFLSPEVEYVSFPDFLYELSKSLNLQDEAQDKLATSSVAQLAKYNCLLAWQPEFLLHIARASNNCRVFIQQAEADWLKFDALYNNGLKEVWESAHANPSLIHFFIIQDFNLAIIDCYAKPLLDLNTGLRNKLPGTERGFPRNLHVFAIPIKNSSSIEFGMPLMRESFAKWGALPKLKDIEFPKGSEGQRLSVQMFSKPFLTPSPDFESYFEN